MFVKNWQPGQLGITLAGAEQGAKAPPILVAPGAQGTLFGGDASDNTIIGTAGSDVLAGGRGADYLVGGDGDDFIYGDMTITSATAQSDTEAGWSMKVNDNGGYSGKGWSYDKTDGTMPPDPTNPGNQTANLARVGENDTLDGGAGNDHFAHWRQAA